jgi:hypothetical protein
MRRFRRLSSLAVLLAVVVGSQTAGVGPAHAAMLLSCGGIIGSVSYYPALSTTPTNAASYNVGLWLHSCVGTGGEAEANIENSSVASVSTKPNNYCNAYVDETLPRNEIMQLGVQPERGVTLYWYSGATSSANYKLKSSGENPSGNKAFQAIAVMKITSGKFFTTAKATKLKATLDFRESGGAGVCASDYEFDFGVDSVGSANLIQK